MPRPLKAALPVLLLTLYGALGLLGLGFLAGLVALALRGGGLAEAVSRLGLAAVMFLVWLYAWRRVTLIVRDRLCSRRA